MEKSQTLLKIFQEKLIAVIRGESSEDAISLTNAVIHGGIQIIELTYTTPFVEKAFKQLQDSKALIGAGTVLDANTAVHAILNGAKFVVSPHFDSNIAIVCNRYRIPYLPGCMTIKEIVQALEYGADIIKLFPANHFEPSFIRNVKGPLPYVNIMPTGGINAENISEWLQAGAFAIGLGSDISKAYVSGGQEKLNEVIALYKKALV